MGKKKPTTRVTEYYTSIQYGICHGFVEKLISIRVNDKYVGKCASMEGPVIYIDDPDLFGGVKKEGGLRGRIAWQPGSFDQLLDSYVASKKGRLPTDLPGYRGIATAFFTEWPDTATTESALEPGRVNSIFSGLSAGIFGSSVGGFLGGLGRSVQKGFYWSANQPIIPPVHFRVTRLDRSWLPDIAAIPGDGDFGRLAICIAMDVSISMNEDDKIDIAKEAVVQFLRGLKANPESETIDVRVAAWSAGLSSMERRNCTQEDYDDLIGFVEGRTTSSGTVFTKAVEGLDDFYEGAEGKCRSFLFLTDGEPNSTANATTAGEILAATGATAHAFNLVLSDTTQTVKMDNTPSDGVPVIALGSALAHMTNLFKATSSQQVDANPAHIIRECLLNTVWGLGLPESAINDTMFQDAAQTLYDERFGLSLMWSRQSEVHAFVSDILSHIQGTIYVNPMTGKICLKLIRNDYDPDTLDTLNLSNCTVTSFKRRSPAEITNEINVTWTNPVTEKEEVITRQSLGSIVASNGEVIPDNRNYHGIRRAELAAQVCDRDLAASIAPLSTAEVNANRAFSRKVPGDVVKLTDPENGAEQLIMRIMKIDYGQVGSSEIQMTLTEDVFSYTKARYVSPSVSGSGTQASFPVPPAHVEFMTMNSFMNQSLSDGIEDLVDPETQVAFFIATSAADTFNVEIYQEETSTIGVTSFETIGEFDLIGRALLTAPLAQEAESEMLLPIPTVGFPPVLGAFAFIGETGLPESHHEIVLITAINGTTGVATIRRAVMDTVPWDWPVGTPVRYLDRSARALSPNIAITGIATDYRLHPKTSLGSLPVSLAPVLTYTATERLYAPARPANVTVAGAAFGKVDASAIITIDVTWANRNRLTEDSVLLRWDEASVSEEIGQTTTVRLSDDETEGYIVEYAGLSGTSHSFPASVRGAANKLRVEVISTRDGIESIQSHKMILEFAQLSRMIEDGDSERIVETSDDGVRATED